MQLSKLMKDNLEKATEDELTSSNNLLLQVGNELKSLPADKVAKESEASELRTNLTAEISRAKAEEAKMATSEQLTGAAEFLTGVIAGVKSELETEIATKATKADITAPTDKAYGRKGNEWVEVQGGGGGGGGGSTSWDNITGKPETFPPSSHTHEMADVSGLETALGNKANSADVYAKDEVDRTVGALNSAIGNEAAAREGLAYTMVENFHGINATINTKANSEDVYTKNEIDGKGYCSVVVSTESPAEGTPSNVLTAILDEESTPLVKSDTITKIEKVTEVPSEPEDGVLYIVVEA